MVLHTLGQQFAVAEELVVCTIGEVLFLRPDTAEHRSDSTLRDVKRTGDVLLRIIVRIDNRGRFGEIAFSAQLHFKTRQRFKRQFDVEIGGVGARCRLHNGGISGQPAVAFGTVHHVVRDESEGEVKARRVRTVHFALSHETGFRLKARQSHGVRLTVRHLKPSYHRTDIREDIACYLRRRTFVRIFGTDGNGGTGAIRFRGNSHFGISRRLERDRYRLSR